MQGPPRKAETTYIRHVGISQLRPIFVSIALSVLVATAGCTPADNEQHAPQAPSTEFDIAEQALIGFALKKAERGIYNATLIEHHPSMVTAERTICGSFFLQDDSTQRTQYFVVNSESVFFAKSKEEDIWKNNC